LVIALDSVQVLQHEVEGVLKIIYALRCAAYLAEIIKLGGATAHTANILQCMGWGGGYCGLLPMANIIGLA
jgi:hypothetical protein